MCLHIYLRLSFRPKPQNRLYKYIENKNNQKNKEKIWNLNVIETSANFFCFASTTPTQRRAKEKERKLGGQASEHLSFVRMTLFVCVFPKVLRFLRLLL